MLDLSIDRDLDARLDQVRRLGREHLRPLGIEADRRREPVPPDHRFFALAWRMGIGQPLGVEERPASDPRTGARRGVVLAEEMSYWDRGMSVAMPGLGLGGPPLLGMGTPEQKERFLAPFRDREPPTAAARGRGTAREIGRAHAWTPVTQRARIPASSWRKKAIKEANGR